MCINVKTVPVVRKPRKALSAYNYFFKAERAGILGVDIETLEKYKKISLRKHRKTPGMIGFKGMAVLVANKWKSISEDEKIPFQVLSNNDKRRYERELSAWEKENASNMQANKGETFMISKLFEEHCKRQKSSLIDQETKDFKMQSQRRIVRNTHLSCPPMAPKIESFDCVENKMNFTTEDRVEPTPLEDMVGSRWQSLMELRAMVLEEKELNRIMFCLQSNFGYRSPFGVQYVRACISLFGLL